METWPGKFFYVVSLGPHRKLLKTGEVPLEAAEGTPQPRVSGSCPPRRGRCEHPVRDATECGLCWSHSQHSLGSGSDCENCISLAGLAFLPPGSLFATGKGPWEGSSFLSPSAQSPLRAAG